MIKHVISVSGGKDSTALLLLALERCPRESVIPIFCDTGNEHQAVYDHLDYLERTLFLKIKRLRADFSAEIASKRLFIARDVRTGRQYDHVPKVDLGTGKPVWIKDKHGKPAMFPVIGKDGKPTGEQAPRQAVGKVGGGRKVRWTNKAKRRALAALQPTGNNFLDLCMLKGRFPSRMAQFCTEELKRNMAVEFQLGLVDAGHRVISWQGIRREESMSRRNAKLFNRIGPRMWAFRPIVEWTARQVFDYCASHGTLPNPLYLQGMGRVGCMPCINCRKEELREIATRFPAHIERIAAWEPIVGACSKRGFSTFFGDAHAAKDPRKVFADLNIWSRVEWSKTTRGGRQFDLLADLAEPTACSSVYGLCE